MLGKLLKHEFKSAAKVMLLFYAALILLSVIFTVSFRMVPDIADTMEGNFHFSSGEASAEGAIGNVFEITAVLSFLLFYFMIIVVGVSTVIYSINRFKNTVLGPEGYLTHTLPVKTRDIIISKTINAIIWQTFSAIAVIISIFIIVVSFLALYGSALVFADIVAFPSMELTEWIMVLEVLVLLFLSSVSLYLQIFASMSVGFSSNRHRILKSVGIYILFSWVAMFINTILFSFDMEFVDDTKGTTISLLFIYILLSALYCVAYYFITHHFLSKKLNLQ